MTHKSIALTGGNRRVSDEAQKIQAKQCILNRCHHAPVKFVPGLVNTWSVHENNLTVGFCYHSFDLKPRCLRLFGHSRDLLPNKTVEQCRFACVWSADKCDVAAVIVIGHVTVLNRTYLTLDL